MLDNDQPGDLLDGAGPIARFLGVTQRRVYYLAANEMLPTFKLGEKIVARRSRLTAWMSEIESGKSQPAPRKPRVFPKQKKAE
jgi:hypothetical protein